MKEVGKVFIKTNTQVTRDSHPCMTERYFEKNTPAEKFDHNIVINV